MKLSQRQRQYWPQDETRLGVQTLLDKRITAVGVNPATGASFFYKFSHLDPACFECFLKQLSKAYPDVLNLIQLDQAPAHTSQVLAPPPDNVVLLDQPAHSPESNPYAFGGAKLYERVWQDLKRGFKGENFEDLDALKAAITEVLGYLTPEWLQSLTQYPFIMNTLSVSISS